MSDSLLRWLGLDKPPNQRVRHKVWRKQLTDSTRQLRLGADRARQRTELEMLDGTEVYSAVDGAGAESMAGGAGPEFELGPTAEEEVRKDSEFGHWSGGGLDCRHWCELGGGDSWG